MSLADDAWAEIDERVRQSIPGWVDQAATEAVRLMPEKMQELEPVIEENTRLAVRSALESESFRQKLGYEKRQLAMGALGFAAIILIGTYLIVKSK